jgi:hypothetical protein
MHRLIIATLVFAGLAAVAPRKAAATQLSIELRHTPILVRPNGTPSLCPMLALALTPHWWVGTGYELIQDYDAILWTTNTVGHKPLVMSGIRAGTWYRGGASHHGMSYSMGGLLTFANPAFSLDRSPSGLDSDTTVVDFGADFTLGRIWQTFRIELFATPAWSYGRVTSKAINRDERYSAFTYRVGGALAFLVGS